MMEIHRTERFADWLEELRDRKVRSMILVRIDRLRLGLFGDVKPVGGGVSELRIDFGPGYRLYFAKRGKDVIFLLAGGDKGSQSRDIRLAHELAAKL